MAHHLYQSKGFILRSFNLGESNKYFHIFTEDLGLIKASAQNIRSLSSKLRYNLQDFSFSCFDLVRGKSFWKVTNVFGLKNYYFVFAKDKEKLEVFAKVFLLIEKMLGEGEENHLLFHSVIDAFDFLEKLENDDGLIKNFELILVLRIINILGYFDFRDDKFSDFLINTWNTELLNKVENFKEDIISEINKSIRASQL